MHVVDVLPVVGDEVAAESGDRVLVADRIDLDADVRVAFLGEHDPRRLDEGGLGDRSRLADDFQVAVARGRRRLFHRALERLFEIEHDRLGHVVAYALLRTCAGAPFFPRRAAAGGLPLFLVLDAVAVEKRFCLVQVSFCYSRACRGWKP